LDDVWTQNDFDVFPEKRMQNLLVITGSAFLRALQARMGTVSLWSDPFPKVKAAMHVMFISDWPPSGARQSKQRAGRVQQVGQVSRRVLRELLAQHQAPPVDVGQARWSAKGEFCSCSHL
jgi:hypothetical protein